MAALGVLLLAVVLAACASIAFGARVVSLAEIVQGLRDGGDGAGLGAVA
ncbi:hypothetical protein HMPREF0058_2256, partial [Actinomyces urogenitalis DSM 15434]